MLLAAVRSVATYLAVAVYVLIAAPVGMILATIFRWKGLLYVLGHTGVGLLLWGLRNAALSTHSKEHEAQGRVKRFSDWFRTLFPQ